MKCVPLIAALAVGQIPLFSLNRDVVTISDGTAVAMAPPVCVYSPMAEQFEWSNSGRFLMVVGITLSSYSLTKPATPRLRIELIEWRTRKATTISDIPAGGRMNNAQWVGDDCYVMTSYEILPSGPQRKEPATRQTLTLHRAGTTQSWPLYDTGEVQRAGPFTAFATVAVKHGYAVIVDASRSGERQKVFLVNYLTGKRTPITPVVSIDLDEEGYLSEHIYKDRKFTGQARRYLPNGTSEERLVKSVRSAEKAVPNLRLMPSPAMHKIGKKTEVANGVWLMSTLASDHQFALVAADCKKPVIAPDRSAIAYMDSGNVFVRELLTLGKGEFDALLEREEQNEAMSKAKQMATAIHIYMADSDDVFPPQEGFADLIMPYVKNRAMVDGFTYTFDKRSATGIAEPAETVIGYVRGRKGRAVAYADGHVRWIKNP